MKLINYQNKILSDLNNNKNGCVLIISKGLGLF